MIEFDPEVVKTAFIVFFIGFCTGLFFGMLSRCISAVAGILKHLIS